MYLFSNTRFVCNFILLNLVKNLSLWTTSLSFTVNNSSFKFTLIVFLDMIALSPYQRTHDIVNRLDALRQAYIHLRQALPKMATMCMALITIKILRMYLWLIIKRLKRGQKNLTQTIVTTHNYTDLRKHFNLLTKDLDKLQNFNKIPVEKAPIGFRGFFRDIRCISDLLLTQHQQIATLLHALDGQSLDGDLFKHVSEDQLWQRRIPTYEFLV